MKLINLYQLLTPWARCDKKQPTTVGWYRVRTEPLSGAWWNSMGYFDGKQWWRFGVMGLAHGGLRVREELPVIEWQGLLMPAAKAAQLIRDNLPKTSKARKSWLAYAVMLETAPLPA